MLILDSHIIRSPPTIALTLIPSPVYSTSNLDSL